MSLGLSDSIDQIEELKTNPQEVARSGAVWIAISRLSPSLDPDYVMGMTGALGRIAFCAPGCTCSTRELLFECIGRLNQIGFAAKQLDIASPSHEINIDWLKGAAARKSQLVWHLTGRVGYLDCHADRQEVLI